MTTSVGTIRAAFRGHLGKFKLDAAFEVPAHGVTALFGPSGCGKTSVLRCMAGLIRFDPGTCIVDGDIWQDAASFRATFQRPVGYVFQEASLFPHLTVRQNLLYGARNDARLPNAISLTEVTDILGLQQLLDRSPRNLSGGERQRVAIGRALMSCPKLLLMDEPLAALDQASKQDILPRFERLHRRLSLPVLYVSHDMAEVEQLADHLILMERGAVCGVGSLSDLQSDPSLPLIKGRDAAVSLNAVAIDYDKMYGLLHLAVDGGRFLVPSVETAIGHKSRLRVLAGDVSLAVERPFGSTILNVLVARILTSIATSNWEMTAVLGLGPQGEGARLLARVTRRSWETLHLKEQMRVYAQVKSVALAPSRTAPTTDLVPPLR
jgi:molybdate transport system ATP-binding protein